MSTARVPIHLLGLALSLAVATALAGPPPGTPPEATGLCGDGGHTVRPERKGACKGREGVKEWWGPAASAPRPAHAGSAATAASMPRKAP